MKPAKRFNIARKRDRIAKAERKFARLSSRGARRRTLARLTSRIVGLRKKLEASHGKD